MLNQQHCNPRAVPRRLVLRRRCVSSHRVQPVQLLRCRFDRRYPMPRRILLSNALDKDGMHTNRQRLSSWISDAERVPIGDLLQRFCDDSRLPPMRGRQELVCGCRRLLQRQLLRRPWRHRVHSVSGEFVERSGGGEVYCECWVL